MYIVIKKKSKNICIFLLNEKNFTSNDLFYGNSKLTEKIKLDLTLMFDEIY